MLHQNKWRSPAYGFSFGPRSSPYSFLNQQKPFWTFPWSYCWFWDEFFEKRFWPSFLWERKEETISECCLVLEPCSYDLEIVTPSFLRKLRQTDRQARISLQQLTGFRCTDFCRLHHSWFLLGTLCLMHIPLYLSISSTLSLILEQLIQSLDSILCLHISRHRPRQTRMFSFAFTWYSIAIMIFNLQFTLLYNPLFQ